MPKCPHCDSDMEYIEEVQLKSRKGVVYQMVKQEWTLSNGHPDYSYRNNLHDPPLVNLICVKCQTVYKDQWLPGDVKKWQILKRINAVNMQLELRISGPSEISYLRYDECHDIKNKFSNNQEHRLVRLHRITEPIKIYSDGVFEIDIDRDLKLKVHLGWIRVSLNDDNYVPSEGETVHGWDSADPFVQRFIVTETILDAYEGDKGIKITEEASIPINASTCFIAPDGFEFNPVDEMEDVDRDALWDGMLKKQELKMESARRKAVK